MKENNKTIGNLGEKIACTFLMKHNYLIVRRNYLKKCGELDIVARKAGILHFIEVKSVSCENVSYETKISNDCNKAYNKSLNISNYRPEDNVHPQKLKRISRTIRLYFLENGLNEAIEWQFDLITVVINQSKKIGSVSFLANLII